MANESDHSRDEAGKALVEFGRDVGSKRNEPQKHVLDVATESSPTKLVVTMKNSKESGSVERGEYSRVRNKMEKGENEKSLGKKRFVEKGENEKSLGKKRFVEKWENEKSLGKKRFVEEGEKKSSVKNGKWKMRDHNEDSELKGMWDTVAGGISEDDQEGVRIVDDDNFIDDSAGDPSGRYKSDNKHSPSQAPQAEEDNEIEELFKFGKKKKKEPNPTGIVVLVETTMAKLHVVVEEDAELNRQEKPATTKLRNLSLLTDIIPRKHLQQEFLDRGVLNSLREWLEPLPDGSIPSIDVRAAVLKCLNDLTIDLEQPERRQQMKMSGIGKAVMFFSKYNEETTANRKLAKALVDKWSRAIYNISTKYEDMKTNEEKRTYKKRPPIRRAVSNAAAGASQDHDLKCPELSQRKNSGPSSSKPRASRPEAMAMDFMVRPRSKVDPKAVRAQAKQPVLLGHRAKLEMKLQKLNKAYKRKFAN